MNWVDILKETITQGRVKEIEDIDIDIEDDNCLRWLNKLYSIITRYPEGEMRESAITEEKLACDVKDTWENKDNIIFERKTHPALDSFEDGVIIRTYFKDKDNNVRLSLINNEAYKNSRFSEDWEKKYDIRLFGSVDDRHHLAVFSTNNKERVIKVTKEICNYLNLDYNRLLGAVA